MAKPPGDQPAPPPPPAGAGAAVADPSGLLTGPQASIEGFTGRYLVLVDPKQLGPASRALASGAGIRVSAVGDADLPEVDSRSIPEGEAMLFGDIGVAVINAAPDRLQSVSTAVARSDELEAMEPERFVYATADVDLVYLRGFRDAVNQLYDRFSEGVTATGAAPFAIAAAGYNETQLSWGLQATGVPGTTASGKRVRVAVLDTGIDLTHPDFQGKPIISESFIAGETVQDGYGHGTHCAGIVGGPFQPRSLPRYAVAPNVELLIGKVLANSGRGTDSSILAGIRWAVAQGASIVSMSLGSPVSAGTNYSYIFQQVAERALQGGTLIVAAAGNDSRRGQARLEAVSHPANCPAIMAVAAVDRDGRPADFSNAGLNANGGKVDVAAPGVDIVSAFPGALQYKRLDGTSMATPHVAGIAALYAEAYPDLSGYALWARLVQQALPLSSPARDVGAGLVQAPR